MEPSASKISYDEPGSSVHVSDQNTPDRDTDSDDSSSKSDSSRMATAEFTRVVSSEGNALVAPTTRTLSPSDSDSGDESFSLSADDDDEPVPGDESPNLALCSPIIQSEQRGDAEGHNEEVELNF